MAPGFDGEQEAFDQMVVEQAADSFLQWLIFHLCVLNAAFLFVETGLTRSDLLWRWPVQLFFVCLCRCVCFVVWSRAAVSCVFDFLFLCVLFFDLSFVWRDKGCNYGHHVCWTNQTLTLGLSCLCPGVRKSWDYSCGRYSLGARINSHTALEAIAFAAENAESAERLRSDLGICACATPYKDLSQYLSTSGQWCLLLSGWQRETRVTWLKHSK